MDLLSPDIGLTFWTFISFGLLIFLLTKYAWKPILKQIEGREQTITTNLNAAQVAEKKVIELKQTGSEIIRNAKSERETIIKDAQKIAAGIIEKAKQEAKKQADKIIDNTQSRLLDEQKIAANQLRKEVAALSFNIAEKLIVGELKNKKAHNDYIEKIIK